MVNWREVCTSDVYAMTYRLTLVFPVVLLLLGCAGQSRAPVQPLLAHLSDEGEEGQCARFFVDLNRLVFDTGVTDAEAAQIAGFPYLRVDRFLASYRDEPMDNDTFDAWADHLQDLDRQARKLEIANLPENSLQHLRKYAANEADILEKVTLCGQTLRARDLADDNAKRKLRQKATVSDNYSTFKRVVGIYPISSAFVNQSILNLHENILDVFATPIDSLPVKGQLVHYVPPVEVNALTPNETAAIINRITNNPLSIPQPSALDRDKLFATFAPILEIDVVDNNDRIGTLNWDSTSMASVDVIYPRVYQRFSYTRFQGKILLQLNYLIWFPARPLTGRFDMLGGKLDGLTWRVTLGPHGRPILYDAMHNCGCYHMFFPSPTLHERAQSNTYQEPPLIPQTAPEVPVGQRILIRIAHRTHYLQRILATPKTDSGTAYVFNDYHALRSLPLSSGRYRSLFREDAIVSGTERGERWYLWPMGVLEPGAMRQWGNHATAFIGKRHFDDPDLIDRYFEMGTADLAENGLQGALTIAPNYHAHQPGSRSK